MSNNTNKTNVPEAKEAMDRFKMEVANELGVPLSNGYNGNLTSAQNGSVGGYMVKKMIENQERQMQVSKLLSAKKRSPQAGFSVRGGFFDAIFSGILSYKFNFSYRSPK